LRIVATTLLTLGVELVLGTVIYALGSWAVARYLSYRNRTHRPWVASWSRATRSLVRALPVATALGLLGIGLHLLAGLEPRSVTPWASPLAFLLLGGLATASALLVLLSGRLEATGRIRAARRQIRLSGKLMFLGIFAQLVLMWTDLLFRPRFRVAIVRDAPVAALAMAGGMLALGCAAFVGLLAGLSGKPRPSGGFATLLYLAGLAGILGAAGLVLGP
jgi:hypothetical protein